MGLTAGVASRELGVSVKTLATWADQGRLRASRTVGNWRLYNVDDVAKLKRQLERRR